ncbi:hypothetical protein Tco_0308421 [Tanacetum coccineum]
MSRICTLAPQWLTIGSNLLFNHIQKIQKNPIFQISVDILSNTNFFQAFTASANVPAIYLQQFWKTMSYNEKTGVYSCQVDEQWFDLSADLLRKALAITPVNPTHPFVLPLLVTRAILSLLNQCLTGKTSGSDKPRHPVLQMLWGIVTQTNVDHAELIWEEFTQGIQTFFSHKASHNASLKNPKKKVTPLLIPYGRFSKVIIYYLASNNNIHRRPESAVHHTGDDYVLGNLKFVPKGESVENTKKTPKKVQACNLHKRCTTKKPTTTTPVKQSKPAPPPTKKPSKHKLPQKVRKGKPSFQLVDEDDEAQQESIPHEEGNDPDLERAKKMSLEALQEQREGEGDDADLERAIKLSLDPAFLPQGRAPVGGVTIRDPVSETTSKLHEVVGKGKAVVNGRTCSSFLIVMSKKKELLVLERHTADLIEKYSVLPGPESVKNQESEKSPKEIIKAKKEQGEEKQDSTYSIRSTNKVDLEEFDLKSALFRHMNRSNAMDKEVADKVKDHKRKHDSDDDDEDDDDDEGPSAE